MSLRMRLNDESLGALLEAVQCFNKKSPLFYISNDFKEIHRNI